MDYHQRLLDRVRSKKEKNKKLMQAERDRAAKERALDLKHMQEERERRRVCVYTIIVRVGMRDGPSGLSILRRLIIDRTRVSFGWSISTC